MAGPGGREVGRLSVRVLPDTSNFATSLQRYLDRVESRARVSVRVEPDRVHFQQQMTQLIRRWDRTRLYVRIGIQDESIRESMRHLRNEVRARSANLSVDVRARLEVDEAEIQRLRRRMANIRPPIQIPAALDVDRTALNALTASFAGSGGGGGGGFSGGATRIQRITRALVAMTPAIPALASLTSSLAQIGPAASLAAPAVVGLGTAVGASVIAFNGMGAAISKGGKALKDVTPSAANFARSLRGLRDEWAELQDKVQEEFFRGWGDAFDKAAKETLPVLEKGLVGAADAMNLMGKETFASAQEMSENGTLGHALKGANRGMKNLASVPGDILESIVALAAGASPAFDRFTQSIADGVADIRERLVAAFESGALEREIDEAISVAGQFWRVLKNIGTTLGNVFGPAAAVGGGFLGTLEAVTATLSDVTGTKAAEDAFTALFEILHTIAEFASQNLGAALGAVIPIVGTLAQTLSGPIADVADKITPVFEDFADSVATAVAPAVEILGEILGEDLLPVFGEIVAMVGDTLNPIIRDTAPLWSDLAQTLRETLAPTLERLPEILQPILDGFAALAPVLLDIQSRLLEAMTPALIELGVALADLLTVIGPLIGALAGGLAGALTAIDPLLNLLLDLWRGWVNLLSGAVLGVIRNVTMPWLRALAALLQGDFSGAWRQVRQLVSNVAGVIGEKAAAIKEFVSGMVERVIGFLDDMRQRAWEKIQEFAGAIVDGAQLAAEELSTAIRNGVENVVEWFKDLPQKAKDALGDIGTFLKESGKALIQGFIDGIKDKINDVKNAVGSVLGSVGGFFPNSPAKEGPFSGRGWVLYSGHAIMRDFSRGLLDYRGLVQDAAGAAVGAAHDPFRTSLAVPAETPAGLQPGDYIALTVDGQTTLEGIIRRGSRAEIDNTLIDPARRGRRTP